METCILNVTVIAGNIHRLRLAANLSQTELAKKLYVNKKTVYMWEKGLAYPNLVNVLSLCNLFTVKVDNLIGVPNMIKK